MNGSIVKKNGLEIYIPNDLKVNYEKAENKNKDVSLNKEFDICTLVTGVNMLFISYDDKPNQTKTIDYHDANMKDLSNQGYEMHNTIHKTIEIDKQRGECSMGDIELKGLKYVCTFMTFLIDQRGYCFAKYVLKEQLNLVTLDKNGVNITKEEKGVFNDVITSIKFVQ